ncbi:thylakoid membrane protein TERC, chloroplastic [Morus notabilis]|uniref:thylakoid membrane protein TERC, chloroplastic n=1 Tax=Morus notabilis TaxID=981085 RepID=UPI000CECF786|nr:thylakoid membrane protein TERC, chloroplastic [Morus notabilis]XP_024028698.1 thylakoid membrane protein TERC, chloroplastic [Morus notabilis]XP_024028743.1 thylakoid membrane protein TERC, chloroplastic [Morus notabilis]XP_024028771.1 thylakoid membrane protein TERC, chloroplastic [Morus notabilis]
MGLASVVHNGPHIHPKLDRCFLLRVSPRSQSPIRTSFHYNCRQIPRLPTARRSGRCQFSPVSCSRGTEQRGDLSASASEKTKENERYASSVRNVAFWVSTAVAFGIGLGLKDGVEKASEFFAGYILEQSLSVDNMFVFVLIFKYFKVPHAYQNRVLSYGIAGAVIFRLTIILLGTATLQRFEAVNILLALILLYSSFKLFATEEDDTDLSDNFIVKTCQRFIPITASYDGNRFFTVQDGVRKATPLLLTVAVIELSDIAFAVDSIPAVFGVTRDPFIVYTSNIFAIIGLRSLYTLISEGMSELEYLQPSIGVVLGFIGCKMILDFFGFHISTEASLGFVATSLGAGVLLSLLKKSD